MEKNNPKEYYLAFCQMVHAMMCLRSDDTKFKKDTYATEQVLPVKDEITKILKKRQLDSCDDWKAFGEKLSGNIIEDFDVDKYREEYEAFRDKDSTFLGRFINGAVAQKSMVCSRIFESGNLLAGIPKGMTVRKMRELLKEKVHE